LTLDPGERASICRVTASAQWIERLTRYWCYPVRYLWDRTLSNYPVVSLTNQPNPNCLVLVGSIYSWK